MVPTRFMNTSAGEIDETFAMRDAVGNSLTPGQIRLRHQLEAEIGGYQWKRTRSHG